MQWKPPESLRQKQCQNQRRTGLGSVWLHELTLPLRLPSKHAFNRHLPSDCWLSPEPAPITDTVMQSCYGESSRNIVTGGGVFRVHLFIPKVVPWEGRIYINLMFEKNQPFILYGHKKLQVFCLWNKLLNQFLVITKHSFVSKWNLSNKTVICVVLLGYNWVHRMCFLWCS